MTMDMVLERIRAANTVHAREADYEELFRAIVATEGDPRLARRRLPRVTGMRLVLAALIVLLILAGTATATYFVLRTRTSNAITFPKGGSIVSVVGSGAAGGRPIWHCPGGANWCGDIAGVAWSPDGEQLALSLGELGGHSPYIGFHIVDLRTGTDRHIAASAATFGCFTPSYLTWSPDGKLLAYTCRDMGVGPSARGSIYTIRPDGTGRHPIATGPFPAFSPTWSPDGKRLAYSTGEIPFPGPPGMTSYRSAVYVVDLAGSQGRRVATGALPDWSPDGKTIAYFAPGCAPTPDNKGRIRLVTPTGRDVTPPTAPCDGIGPAGRPVAAWSPDGQQIAVGTGTAQYVMNANGTGLRLLQRGRFTSLWGHIRPAWRPK